MNQLSEDKIGILVALLEKGEALTTERTGELLKLKQKAAILKYIRAANLRFGDTTTKLDPTENNPANLKPLDLSLFRFTVLDKNNHARDLDFTKLSGSTVVLKESAPKTLTDSDIHPTLGIPIGELKEAVANLN